VEFSPDGHTAITNGLFGLHVWDLSNRTHPRQVATLTNPVIGDASGPMAFSPDGQTVVTGGRDVSLIVWDFSDRTHPRRLSSVRDSDSDSLTTVAFSPDGRTVVTGTSGITAIVWDVSNRTSPRRLSTMETAYEVGNLRMISAVSAIAFSRDGHTVVAATDVAAIVWDISDRAHPHRLQTLSGHTGPVNAVEISPDGHTVITGSKRIVLWDITQVANMVSNPGDQACMITKRGLTAEEWARYVPDLPYRRICRP